MPLPHPFIRIVPWAHRFLAEVLRPGDQAVDLTAGNGGDTLFLYGCVGKTGRVLAFDIQEEALARTEERLREVGAAVCRRDEGEEAGAEEGIILIRADHAQMKRYGSRPLRGVIANLGYLPGGDPRTTTEAGTTRAALQASLDLLAPGGRLAVVVYVGHPGGEEEAAAVQKLFSALPPETWLTLQLGVPNRPLSPYLLLAEKKPSR